MSLVIHPLTHVVYKIPKDAIAVPPSVVIPLWMVEPAAFELIVRAGRFRPELLVPHPAPAQLGLVAIGGALTWACCFQVTMAVDGLRDKLERRTGERFLFLWPLDAAVEVARQHNDALADAFATLRRTPSTNVWSSTRCPSSRMSQAVAVIVESAAM